MHIYIDYEEKTMKFIPLLFLICLHVSGADEGVSEYSPLEQYMITRIDQLRAMSPLELTLQCSWWDVGQTAFKNPWRKRVSDHLRTQAICQMENIKEVKAFADGLRDILLEYFTEKHPDISEDKMKEQASNMLSPCFHLTPETFMHALSYTGQSCMLTVTDGCNQDNPDLVLAKYVKAYKSLLLSCLHFCERQKEAIACYKAWRSLTGLTEKD